MDAPVTRSVAESTINFIIVFSCRLIPVKSHERYKQVAQLYSATHSFNLIMYLPITQDDGNGKNYINSEQCSFQHLVNFYVFSLSVQKPESCPGQCYNAYAKLLHTRSPKLGKANSSSISSTLLHCSN
jgi:hypothetical protein